MVQCNFDSPLTRGSNFRRARDSAVIIAFPTSLQRRGFRLERSSRASTRAFDLIQRLSSAGYPARDNAIARRCETWRARRDLTSPEVGKYVEASVRFERERSSTAEMLCQRPRRAVERCAPAQGNSENCLSLPLPASRRRATIRLIIACNLQFRCWRIAPRGAVAERASTVK